MELNINHADFKINPAVISKYGNEIWKDDIHKKKQYRWMNIYLDQKNACEKELLWKHSNL